MLAEILHLCIFSPVRTQRLHMWLQLSNMQTYSFMWGRLCTHKASLPACAQTRLAYANSKARLCIHKACLSMHTCLCVHKG